MAGFASWLQAAPQTYGTGFEAHYRLVTIHPFSGGNGRTARQLMNLLLMKSGYPPVVTGPKDRVRYLNALETRQMTDDAGPYQAFMKERLRDTLARYVAHIEKELEARQGGLKPAAPPGFKT